MAQTFSNMLDNDEIQELVDFFHRKDEFSVPMPMHTKVVEWQESNWPQTALKRVVDEILGEGTYGTDMILFFEAWDAGLAVHTDANVNDKSKKYHNVSVPLLVEDGVARTVFFDNWWYGPKRGFSRRTDLPQTDEERTSEQGFAWTHAFDNVTNYQADKQFDPKVHQELLAHIPIENLHGLTLKQVIEWKIGDCFVADSQQLHSGGLGQKRKVGITVFTHSLD
jgi:hypothetical protein